MMKPRSIVVSIVVGVLLLVWGEGFAYTLKETFEEVVPAEDAGALRVDNMNGDIEVSSWDRPEVKVEALQEIKASSKEAAEKYAEKA